MRLLEGFHGPVNTSAKPFEFKWDELLNGNDQLNLSFTYTESRG